MRKIYIPAALVAVIAVGTYVGIDVFTGNGDGLKICSFNVQFLGYSTSRDNVALTKILKDFDIVVVQELVAPPFPGKFPDCTDFNPDPEAAEFFDEMRKLEFTYVLSEEDTGTGNSLHVNSSATEWWVTFYKPAKVRNVYDLPYGFLAEDRSNHDDYERVPYAFAFRTNDDNLDFVLISVHLKPGSSPDDRNRREHELDTIASWINANNASEKDFIILGDMNIYSATELSNACPTGFVSLNDECEPTNTNVSGPEPYDHVMYNPTYTTEIDTVFDFRIVDLIMLMEDFWDQSIGPYPGDPYVHDTFRQYYSDHHPVVFKMNIPETDDD